MSTLLVLCVLATAVWVGMAAYGRSSTGSKDSVEDFSRALGALSAEHVIARRPVQRRRRPAPRPRSGSDPSSRPLTGSSPGHR
jgi:hypothetical protein